MARLLKLDQITEVIVPDPGQDAARDLVRAWHRVSKLLLRHDIHLHAPVDRKPRDRRHMPGTRWPWHRPRPVAHGVRIPVIDPRTGQVIRYSANAWGYDPVGDAGRHSRRLFWRPDTSGLAAGPERRIEWTVMLVHGS